MNIRLAVVGTLLAGLTIFFWGAISHMVIPDPLTTLPDPKAVTDFVDKNAPANGAYMDPRGVMVIVGLLPDRSDQTQQMGPLLGVEFLTNLVQAFLLLLVLLRLPARNTLQYGWYAMLIGLLAWVSIEVSYWNWYHFSPKLILMGFLDATIGFWLAGLVLGWLIRRNHAHV
ncbi:hypothetical protein [Bryobacter aggregatus]|uniref:hypothetical protein n=1 Tax=Bryobacter aggregatus TaxID=360054 RepID=UPI0004E0EAA8|nr:hypothetical protein [Bryobacter aggregatus]